MDIKEKVKELPQIAGVYIFKNKKGKVLYVGKAANLRKRVLSYFTGRILPPQKNALVGEIAGVEYILCGTEAKALILENSLIKEFRPKYNTALKDGKNYPLIEVTSEEYPLINIVRRKQSESSLYFGPYSNAGLLRQALKIIRKIFPFRSCRRLPERPCLYYHLKLCPGVCLGNVKVDEYARVIKNITLLLSGRKQALLNKIKKDMNKASANLDFEKAAVLRDQYFSLANLYGLSREFEELLSLQEFLRLKKLPVHIEGIDISNTGRDYIVGSVVVFKNGVPSRKDYRRFRIRTISTPNDTASVKEVFKRRYLRLKRERKPLPQLVIIDGGKTHASLASRQAKDLGIDICVIGIAKKREQVWMPYSSEPLNIPRSGKALKMVQKVRDEAHRFAHKYHVLLRQKGMFL